MLTNSGTLDLDFSSRLLMVAAPSLGKPNLFQIALCSMSRARVRPGLATCGSGVTVPISIKPAPILAQACTDRAFLSTPPAKPRRFGKWSPFHENGRHRHSRLGDTFE